MEHWGAYNGYTCGKYCTNVKIIFKAISDILGVVYILYIYVYVCMDHLNKFNQSIIGETHIYRVLNVLYCGNVQMLRRMNYNNN